MQCQWAWDRDGGVGATANTSGQRGAVPPEVAGRRFHLGAFAGGGVWAWAHGLYALALPDVALGIAALLFPAMALLGFVTTWPWVVYVLVVFALVPVSLAFRVYMGRRGHVLAWRHRYFRDLREYWAVQRAWTIGAAVVMAAVVTLLVGLWMSGGLESACPPSG